MAYTGNLAGGFALWTGYLGSTTNNKELKILSSVLSIASLGVKDGAFSFFNIGYIEAIELISNISNIYYSLKSPTVEIEENEIDGDDGILLLYEAPFTLYTEIYEVNNLINIDVELNL
jgi:hypothetical protein